MVPPAEGTFLCGSRKGKGAHVIAVTSSRRERSLRRLRADHLSGWFGGISPTVPRRPGRSPSDPFPLTARTEEIHQQRPVRR